MAKIRFRDTDATLASFHFSGTYSSVLEGHPMYVSWTFLKRLYETMKKGEDLIFVHQGEVVSAEKLNEIEHFDDEEKIRDYIWKMRFPSRDGNPSEAKHQFIELGRGRYEAHFHIGYEYLLTIVWFDDTIDVFRPLNEIIEEKTRNIEYKKYCKFYDLDNL